MPPDNQLPPHHAPTGLKIWLAVFAVVLVVALGFFVWASNTASDTTDNSATTVKTTTVSTADWKTYSNTGFNYSLKYPHDWTLAPTGIGADPASANGIGLQDTCVFLNGDTCLTVDIEVQPESGTLDAYIAKYISEVANKNVTKSSISLGAEPAIKLTFGNIYSSLGDTNYEVAIYTLHDGKIFSVSAIEETSKNAANIKSVTSFKSSAILDAIVASFKFTN